MRLSALLLTAASLLAPPADAGGIYGGITWKAGYYSTLKGGELRGTMLVQPDGVFEKDTPNAANLPFLDLTSTALAPGTPEVYVRYFLDPGGTPGANLDILAWGCKPIDPCRTNNDGTLLYQPGWVQWNWRLREHPEYVSPRVDDGGHRTHALQFINRMEQIGTRQYYTVMLWNNRTLHWDTIWTHDRAGLPENCGDLHCNNFWGPILETHTANNCIAPCPMPRLREVGWEDMQFTHDNGTDTLSPNKTNWVPIHPEWSLFHRTPNRSWSAGNLSNGLD